jgi:PAS domain S-box-containing protein
MGEILRLFAQTGDGMWAVDAEQRIAYWNQAAEELLGYPAEAAVGQLCYRLVAGRDLGGKPVCIAGCSVMERVRRAEPVRGFDLWVRRSDGTALRASVSIIPISGMRGAHVPVFVAHLFRPIGETWPQPLPLRIYLLGHVTVQRADDSPVDGLFWRRAKVRALFAFLALHRGRAVHRDTLIEVLWPDLERAPALRNLNTTVYNLRLSLEPMLQHGAESSYVQHEGDCYTLNGGPAHWLDVNAFETGIAQARQEADSARAMMLYRAALTLYQGDLLAGLDAVCAWSWNEQARLRELYLMALEELGTHCERQQDDKEASSLYRKALATDACRETACQRLMRLWLRRGDRAAAVTQYRRLAGALRRELEISPSPETRLIYEEARRG